MRPLPFTALVTFLCTSLGSCGFMTPAKQYSGDPQKNSNIAIIRSHIGDPFGDDYHATIVSYAQNSESGNLVTKKFGLPGFTDYPKEIHLQPGRYTITAYCFKSLTKPTFRPSIEIEALAAKIYTVKCVVLNDIASLAVQQGESLD